MTKRNHTKAPWYKGSLGNGVVFGSNHVPIANIIRDPAGRKPKHIHAEIRANANLIRTAPEMYDVLDQVANLNPDAGEIGDGMLRHLIEQAQNAIAKAEGKE